MPYNRRGFDAEGFLGHRSGLFCRHGDVDLEHTKDTVNAFLAPQNRDPRQVISTCGQCHLRSGTSRSTGLPYAHNFVAGDNLFRDFGVDLSNKHLRSLTPDDRHIFENTRDVVVHGKTEVTCLSCHDVHAQSSEKHQALAEDLICSICHLSNQPDSGVRHYQSHSKVCGY